jgi:hypothetical protein
MNEPITLITSGLTDQGKVVFQIGTVTESAEVNWLAHVILTPENAEEFLKKSETVVLEAKARKASPVIVEPVTQGD